MSDQTEPTKIDTSVDVESQAAAEAGQPEVGQPEVDLEAQKLVGTRIAGKYLILEVLGSGGMSVVYKARQDSVDRIVAVKTLKVELSADPVILQRFRREILSLSKLNHPNIVTVYDCGMSEHNQPFIVMDFVSGQSLEALLSSEGRLSPEQARRIFIQVCNALEHAHRNGVTHRDIKPGNIMLTGRPDSIDFVKVVDFGLAKLTEDTQKLTQTGHLWGSAPYMSPEQCEANEATPIDWRSDIYSFGCVMYEVLTGADPFLGEMIMDTLWKHMNEDPLRFSEVDQTLKLSPILEQIVFKSVAKKREDRFQSMLELREALESAIPEVIVPTASRVGMAPARPPTASRPAPGRGSKSPFSLKKKETNKLAGLQHAFYGFLACLLLFLVFFYAKSAFFDQSRKIDEAKKSATTQPAQSIQPSQPTQPAETSRPAHPSGSTRPSTHSIAGQGETAKHNAETPAVVHTPKEHIAVHHKPVEKPVTSQHHPAHAKPAPAKKPGGGESPWAKLEHLHSQD